MGSSITNICCNQIPSSQRQARLIKSTEPDFSILYEKVLKKLHNTSLKFSIRLDSLEILWDLFQKSSINDPNIQKPEIKWIFDFGPGNNLAVIYEKGVSKFVGKIDENLNKKNGIEIPKILKKKKKPVYEKGIIYNGEFYSNNYHGCGIEYFSVNSFYEGEYFEGLRQGKGRLTLENGDVFKGDFSAGLPNGYGTYFLDSKKVKYKGQVSNGIISGQGSLTFQSGVKYKGDFAAGKMHGSGLLTLKNNPKYTVKMSENSIKNPEFP